MIRKTGSISLFLCLLLSGILLVGSLLSAAAWLRSAELDLARALDSQVQVGLAAYDRAMLEQFGLLGLRLEKIDRKVFAASLDPPLSDLPLQVSALAGLFSPDELERQIVGHMQGRLPFLYLENLTGYLSGWQAPDDSGAGFLHRTGSMLGSLPLNETQRTSRGLFGGILGELQEESALWLDGIYRRYAAQLIGSPADGAIIRFFGLVPDLFDPADLAVVAAVFDNLLDMPAAPLYEKLCLVEYIMGYFIADVRVARQGGTTRSLLTIDGRPKSDFPNTRQAEIEQIIFGLTKPDQAVAAFRMILISLRSVINLGAIIMDETQMAAFRSAALAICAAVAALTSGAVVVEPEIMTWLLAAGKALIDGWNDYNRLRRGEYVPLWPGDIGVEISLHYSDYLRVFLLAQPRQLLLDRCAFQLRKVLPGDYTTRIEAAVIFNRQRYAVSGAYP